MYSKANNLSQQARVPLLVALTFVILFAVYEVSKRTFQTIELDKGTAKLSLYQAIIENELSRLKHLPQLLAKDTVVSDINGLNERYKSIALSSKSEAIYLLNDQGITVAASNYDQPKTFLGQNYQFRPYFINAMQGAETSFFAIGATTSRPGYFLAAPVFGDHETKGALVIKLDLTALNRSLERSNDKVLVTNKDGIVVLSSIPDFRYRSTRLVSADRLKEIQSERQFGSEDLESLSWDEGRKTILVENEKFQLLDLPLQKTDWKLHYLMDESFARTRAFSVSTFLAALMTGFYAMRFVFRERRVRKALETSQKDRRRLQREIEVRRRAEQRLEQAQTALKRSSKLAALGQLSASVTHELGQPISSMKNHIAAELLVNKKAPKVFNSLSGIVDRMDNITKQLKFFATKGEDFEEKLSLNDVISRTVELMRHDFDFENVEVILSNVSNKNYVSGNAQRLEQVFINILRNSLKAMQGIKNKRIEITSHDEPRNYLISFCDNGYGLKGQTLDQITEPFHTTGPSGEGIGLGLAISASIIEEHDGTMIAKDAQECGAIFEIRLPKADG